MGSELPPGDGAGLRVGIPRYFWDDIDPEVEKACSDALAATGWQSEDVDIAGQEHTRAATVLHLAIDGIPEFGTAHLADADPLTQAYTKFALLLPAHLLVRADRHPRAAAPLAGRDVRALRHARVPDRAGAGADDRGPDRGPAVRQHSGGPANVRQTGLANLAGAPAMNVPAGTHSSGLPMGSSSSRHGARKPAYSTPQSTLRGGDFTRVRRRKPTAYA